MRHDGAYSKILLIDMGTRLLEIGRRDLVLGLGVFATTVDDLGQYCVNLFSAILPAHQRTMALIVQRMWQLGICGCVSVTCH